jgi:hypothetical protein
MNVRITTAAAAAVLAALAAGVSAAAGPPGPPPGPAPHVTVFASGLNNPRGMAFAPDGALYVAEAGTGGSATTDGNDVDTAESETSPCRQVPAAGPYKGGFSSDILRIDRHGEKVVVGGLPSSQTSDAAGTLVSGVADVKFLGGRLYAIEAGAGCSHGLDDTHNGLFRVDPSGKTRELVDLSAYLIGHPPLDRTFERDDWEPDGTWYSLAVLGHALYATEPNHQVIERITPHGEITRVADLSLNSLAQAEPEWIGPASLSVHGRDLYFGALGPFPVAPGDAAVWKLTPDGSVSVYASGLTAVLGTAWDDHGRLYALESMTATGFPGPGQAGTGKVVRIDPDHTQTTILEGLNFPSAIAFGPDHALYISNDGFGNAPGAGQILKVTVPS